MKKVQFLSVVLGLAGALSASANNFTVEINNDRVSEAKEFGLHVTTVETHSSMCGLTLTKVEVTKSLVPNGIEIMPVDDLKLNFELNPNAICMMAFGPHRGGATLAIGEALPKLSGLYNLVINGEDYGILRVNAQDGAILENIVENN